MPPTSQASEDGIALKEWLCIGAVLVIAGLAHGVNMFGYPYRESDEGTYMAQAWAVVHQGRLAPYTYWYDHAPAGWLQIAGWTCATGGFYTFGAPVDSGRVLMLLMRLASVLMLYGLARSASKSVWTSALAALLFALSAYGIYHGRRVLLDNIAAFWMLLAMVLLACGRFSLKRAVLSAAALAIAILSKETVVVLIPVLAYLAWYRGHRQQRIVALAVWLATLFCLCSIYGLMAVLHGELFPSGTWLGGSHEHVSLLGTLRWQASRDPDGGLLDRNSAFWIVFRFWASWERLLVIGGTLAALVNCALVRRRRLVGVVGVAAVSLWLFLGRGGTTLEFHLVPLVPLLAINLALTVGLARSALADALVDAPGPVRAAGRALSVAMSVACMAALAGGYTNRHLPFWSGPWVLWTNRQADALTQASRWLSDAVAADSHVVIDVSMWTELHGPPGGVQPLDNAHYYWKVLRDPPIRKTVFREDWRSIDYIVTTPQLLRDIAIDPSAGFVVAAMDRSSCVARFDTGGWPVEVRIVHKPRRAAGSKTSQPGE